MKKRRQKDSKKQRQWVPLKKRVLLTWQGDTHMNSERLWKHTQSLQKSKQDGFQQMRLK